ncbi:MAG: MFS transporter [Saprospiraceae bacterium]|nr:MFS transporter [Saprospiraceae bacterium]
MSKHEGIKNPLNIIVIVAALGYFVDIYDLILFGIVRVPSLKGIGISDAMLLPEGIFLLNMQMAGMLIGGIIWGIMGDKRGRLPVLFFTIALYSMANIANGFVQNMEQYAILRFIAGVGLSGELGIGITLVSEVMSKESRGYGTAIVSGIGIFGAVLGFLVADFFDWRVAYWFGGGLGIMLLLLRASVFESGMFEKTKSQQEVKRGDFLSIFTDKQRLLKYIYNIIIGIPIWYIVSILVIQSPELSRLLNVKGGINGGAAVSYHYIGIAIGSFFIGFLSQWMKSRKKVLYLSMSFLFLFTIIFFYFRGMTSTMFYMIIGILGFGAGYWAVFITTASEQFGTNIRATVTTTVPNFVRGATVPITSSVLFLSKYYGLVNAGIIVGAVCFLLGIIALYLIKETYGNDLDYTE